MQRSQGSTQYVLPNTPDEALNNPEVPSTSEGLFTLLQIKTNLQAPSLEADEILYLSGALAATYEDNLDQLLSKFVQNKGSVWLTDAKSMNENRVEIKITFEPV